MKLSVSRKNQPISVHDFSGLILSGQTTESIFLIGRSIDCHVVLDEKLISREHSKLIYLAGKWRIERLSSDVPLLLNNNSINKEYLTNGDTISIGEFVLSVSLPEVLSESTKNIPDSYIAPIEPVVAVPAKPVFEPQEILPDNSLVSFSDSELADEIEQTSEVHQGITEEFDLPESAGGETGNFSLDQNLESSFVEPPVDTDAFEDNSEVFAGEVLDSENEHADEMSSYSLDNISNDDSSDEGTKVFKTFAAVYLELFGEFAPYDKFILESGKTHIGRDSTKCQIVINDPEVSSLHAVISKNNMIMILEDLNSGNGTLLNGERINKATLNHNDEFIIGNTSFKVKIDSDFLKEELATLMPVDLDQSIEIEEIVEVQAAPGEHIDAFGEVANDGPEEKSIIKRILKDEKKRKMVLYAAVIGLGAWVMLPDDKPPVKKEVKKSEKDINSKTEKEDPKNKTAKIFSEEEKRALSERYQIGKKHFFEGRYRDALNELQKIAAIDPYFNPGLLTLIASSKEGLSKLEEQEKKRKEEEIRAEKLLKVKNLIIKATEYVKDHRADLAADTFNDIAKLDPENIEVSRLKREMDDWVKEKQKKELEIAQKKKDREDKVEKLKPGKNLFLQKDWYNATSKLEEFLKSKEMDEDLIKEASDMLKICREEVSNAVSPLIGKSKSLMEGQDLKGAYEVYQQILKIEPSNADALNAVGEIRDVLNNKARKIYREAIISESLSLFPEAKEKFQEVQQISPVDSEYYKKATDKLKENWD